MKKRPPIKTPDSNSAKQWTSDEYAKLYNSMKWRTYRKNLENSRLMQDHNTARILYQDNTYITLCEYNNYIKSMKALCVHCIDNDIRRLTPADVADHITPIRLGGAMYDDKNIQYLCHTCHNTKTRKEQHL